MGECSVLVIRKPTYSRIKPDRRVPGTQNLVCPNSSWVLCYRQVHRLRASELLLVERASPVLITPDSQRCGMAIVYELLSTWWCSGPKVKRLCKQRMQVTPKLVPLLWLIVRCHQFSSVCFCIWDQWSFLCACDSGHWERKYLPNK